jgi:hypothetical protein
MGSSFPAAWAGNRDDASNTATVNAIRAGNFKTRIMNLRKA